MKIVKVYKCCVNSCNVIQNYKKIYIFYLLKDSNNYKNIALHFFMQRERESTNIFNITNNISQCLKLLNKDGHF